MTWQELIARSLRLCGAIYPGQAYSGSLDEVGFQAASMLLSGWSRDGVLPPALVEMNFTLTPGQYEYTAGVGGDLPMRPLEIDNVIIWGADLGNVRQQLRIDTWTNWRGISQPQIQAVPTLITMNPAFPLAKIYFAPNPHLAYQASIAGKFAWAEVIGARAEQAVLPPGFDDAFCDVLANKIADELQNLDADKKQKLARRASNSYKNLLLSLPYWDAVQANPRVGALSGRPVGDPWSRFVAGAP